jgi:uridine phosphorylase
MNHFGVFEQDSDLIKPVKGKKDPDAATDLILAMTPPILELLVRKTNAEEHVLSAHGLYRLFQAWEKSPNRPGLTLAGPFLGAPQTVLGLEKMIALGARRVFVCGLCGSLQSGLGIGDLLVPLGAISEEGTSSHYGDKDAIPPADEELSRVLVEEVERRGKHCSSGFVWTTDAPYRETRGKVMKYQSKGVLAVEMEMSALLTVAHFRQVRLAGLLAVSDELSSLEWRPGFSRRILKESLHVMIDALLDAIRKS